MKRPRPLASGPEGSVTMSGDGEVRQTNHRVRAPRRGSGNEAGEAPADRREGRSGTTRAALRGARPAHGGPRPAARSGVRVAGGGPRSRLRGRLCRLARYPGPGPVRRQALGASRPGIRPPRRAVAGRPAGPRRAGRGAPAGGIPSRGSPAPARKLSPRRQPVRHRGPRVPLLGCGGAGAPDRGRVRRRHRAHPRRGRRVRRDRTAGAFSRRPHLSPPPRGSGDDPARRRTGGARRGADRGRGPPVLRPSRGLPRRHRARRLGEPPRGVLRAGGQHAHPAAREEPLSLARTHLGAQGRRGGHGPPAGSALPQEGAASRCISTRCTSARKGGARSTASGSRRGSTSAAGSTSSTCPRPRFSSGSPAALPRTTRGASPNGRFGAATSCST